MFYPRFWLNATGYFNNPPEFGPGVLMFQPAPEVSSNYSMTVNIGTVVILLFLTLGFGIYLGKQYFPIAAHADRIHNNREYMAIEMA